MIRWIIENQPVAARGFVAETQKAAEEMCAAQEEYPASCKIVEVRKGVVTLTMLKSDRTVRIVLPDLIRLARELYRHGVQHLYYERRIGRLGPMSVLIDDGPFAGMFYVDVAKAAAGADGDY